MCQIKEYREKYREESLGEWGKEYGQVGNTFKL